MEGMVLGIDVRSVESAWWVRERTELKDERFEIWAKIEVFMLDLFGKEQKVWLSAETDAAVLNDPKTSTCAGTAFELMRSVYIKDG
jgi:hypothetical protein